MAIDGLAASESAPVSLHVEPGHMGSIRFVGEEVDAEAPNHGTVEVDVTSVLGRTRYEWLSVRATHPRAAVRWVDVAVPSSGDDRDRSVRWDARVTLEPVAAIVGRITDERGVARAGRVAAHAIVGRLPSPTATEDAGTADGRFRLRLPEAGPWVIVAQSEGRLPAAVRASGVLGQDTDVGDLACPLGLEIRGRVVSDAPLTEVVAEPTGPVGDSRAWIGPGLLWQGEHAELAGVRAKIEKDGTYALGGLAPRAYRLSVGGSGVDPSLANRADHVASAPATGVDLTLRAAAVTVALRGRTHEVVSARITTSGQEPWSHYWPENDDGTSWTLWVAPQTDGRLRVVSRAFAPFETGFRTPDPGGRIVREIGLVPRDPRTGSLAIEVKAEHGATPATARFTLAPTDGSLPFDREAVAVDGIFHVDAVPVGDYEIDCDPGDAVSTYSRDHVPDPVRVAVLPEGDTRTSIVCVRGGRAAMVARDTDRTRLTPRCDVRRRDGAPIADAAFLPPLDFWGPRPFEARAAALHGIGEQEEMYPPLRPGDYDATFSLEGYRTERAPFRIVGGETTVVAVTMHRR